jgi:hypothetical protein
MIHQVTQQRELADGKSWNGDNRGGACRRGEHPIGNLIEPALRLPDQEMMDSAMFVIANYQHRLSSQWMERVGNDGFECQKPGIMASARTAAPVIGPWQ